MRRTYTEEEDALIRSQPTTDISVNELQKKLKIGTRALRLRASELGVRFRYVRHKDRQFSMQDDEMIYAYARGEINFHTMRTAVRSSVNVIRRRAKELNIELPVGPRVNVGDGRWQVPNRSKLQDQDPEGDSSHYRCSVGEDRLLAALLEGRR